MFRQVNQQLLGTAQHEESAPLPLPEQQLLELSELQQPLDRKRHPAGEQPQQPLLQGGLEVQRASLELRQRGTRQEFPLPHPLTQQPVPPSKPVAHRK